MDVQAGDVEKLLQALAELVRDILTVVRLLMALASV